MGIGCVQAGENLIWRKERRRGPGGADALSPASGTSAKVSPPHPVTNSNSARVLVSFFPMMEEAACQLTVDA